jgi:hypothetical protein
MPCPSSCAAVPEEAQGLAWNASSTSSVSAAGDAGLANRRAGVARIIGVVASLSVELLDKLLCYVRDWNTQSKHNLLAQRVRTRAAMCGCVSPPHCGHVSFLLRC